ncbi:MAG TPA: immune inhibitor A [Flexilinea sp.]|nr:immune inhibitor A [Flexilinea sp.]HPR71933.1 immune inhibitor A [Flexilinea sp.]
MKKLMILIFLSTRFFLLLSPVQAEESEFNAASAEEMQERLESIQIDPADREEIARRFNHLTGELSPIPEPLNWQIGMDHLFWVINTDRKITVQIDAEAVYVGEHIVIWVEKTALSQLSDAVYDQFKKFDFEIYPFEKSVFGSEFSPGIDHDLRIHALFTKEAGAGILGYFSSRDEDHPQVSPHSNAMELFILDSTMLKGNPDQITNTLSHEFQHMIHYAHDANEGSDIDEGFSGLAEYLIHNRLSEAYERSFLENPDISLTLWPVSGSSIPYYGASFLFSKYLADRLGQDFLNKVVEQPQNGFEGIDAALKEVNSNFTADQLFAEWTAANLLNGLSISNGEFSYRDYELPLPKNGSMIKSLSCKNQSFDSTAMQYGTNYYNLSCDAGTYEIEITGQPTIPILSMNPIQGQFAWWSNSVNNSDTWMQRKFDLSKAKDPIRFEFDLNYDLEEAYDFLYLSLSADDGKTWQVLKTAHGTDLNESGFNLGWGWTGKSGGWLHESVDLSEYSGKNVLLRFDLITDQALTGEGVLLDNFRIDAIHFSDDVEKGSSDWEANGFLPIMNLLPQQYSDVLITGDSKNPAIYFHTTEGSETYSWTCDFEQQDKLICAFGISPINRISQLSAAYRIQIKRNGP